MFQKNVIAKLSAYYFVLAFIFFNTSIHAQNNKPLPVDTAMKTGKLANGFTYYIRRNTEPKERVTLYLVNKVGSILEEDNQQGLAHFMEHMNFNGTEHYPKNELVDYLQKSGVRFGADLNAYTSFDETVYQLPLPTDDTALLRNGFQIMRDWAKGALLDSIEIDKERGVILEEERLGKGMQDRMSRQTFPVVLNGSRYAERIPIGKDTVLKNFTPTVLRSFYNTWYRPDLQALVVVGDIDVNAVEQIIKQKFADLKNPVNEKPRTKYSVELTGVNKYIAVTDKEMSYTDIQFTIKRKAAVIKTESDYRNSILQYLYNQMLGSRFAEIKRQPGIPFLDGTVNISGFFNGIDAFNIEAIPVNGKNEEGFKAVYREAERVKRFGFTASELVRVKKDYMSSMQRNVKEKDKIYSDFFVNDYMNYFLTGAVPTSADTRLALAKKMLPGISLDELNTLTPAYFNGAERLIMVQGRDSDKAMLPSEKNILQWAADVQKEKLQPYNDGSKAGDLMNGQPAAGSIIKTDSITSIGVTKWQLSNGATVLLKPTSFANDQIVIKSFAGGGTSLYNDSDFLSATFGAGVVSASGLGDFNTTQLKQYLAGKQASVFPVISNNFQGMNIFTTNDDATTAFQEMYLYFTQPKFDSAVALSQIAQLQENIGFRSHAPETVFSDTMNATLYNNYFRYLPLTKEMVAQINMQKAFDIYKERFADAGNFTFIIVGNIDTLKIKPLVEKYIASLPSTNSHETANPSGVNYAAGNLQKTVYAGTEDKAAVRLIFTGNYNADKADNKAMDALAEVLEIRLLERLREDESGVYSPGATFYFDKDEKRFSTIISFGCAPANVNKLIASALDEVKKIKANGPDNIKLEKYKAETMRNHQTSLQSNGFWVNYLFDQVQNNEPLTQVNNFNDDLKNITTDKIKELANKYLTDANLFQFVLMPEKK